MFIHRRFLRILSVIVVLSLMLSGFSVPAVAAQDKDDVKRERNAQTGKISFIGPESGQVVPASKALGMARSARPADPGMALATRFGPEFGLKNPARDLRVLKTDSSDNGRSAFRYQQTYQDIPVMGAELVVNTNEKGDLYSINGEISSELSLSTQPTIDVDQARWTALQAVAKWYEATPEDFLASEPELWIYDESLLRPSTRPVELVWHTEVTSKEASLPVRELVLVNAEKGSISLHFNQIDTAWGKNRPDPDRSPMPALAGANWYVADTGDDEDSCTTPDHPCRNIQAAISLASGGDVIYVAAGTYAHPGSLNPTANVVVIDKSLSLSGGWQSDFLSQTGMSVIDGGDTNNGIFVNTTGDVLVDRFFVQNSTASTGGALYVQDANFTLSNSALYQNSAAQYGAAVYGTGSAHVTVTTSTIGENTSSGGGTVYADSGTIDIQNSTIVFNDGGMETNVAGAAISLDNSIVWSNGVNCSGKVTSLDNNILPESECDYYDDESKDDDPGIYDQRGVDPQLGSFDAVGGYYPLLLGSPAIDMGPWTCPASDQRGVARPQSAYCDIGAYEYVFSSGGSDLLIQTYDAENLTTLPGIWVCDQTDLTCADGDPHEQAAHQYAVGVYNLYKNAHNRNSIDDNGLEIISSVHYDSGYSNAFWNGYMMIYGDGYGYPLADDIVAHELTHGVTQYESNLYYYYQSGAINESLSDLWGEYYDQVFNATSADTEDVKWLIGEDTLDPYMNRSMSDPTRYDDPDKMSSVNYYFDSDDYGGVHYNSGINNKAVYLMVDGGDFNGFTVSPIGWTKTAAIYYKANTDLLTSGADYSDLYYALQTACSDLIPSGVVTADDCVQVKNAIDAVEMNDPLPGFFNEDTTPCGSNRTRTVLFTDGFESSTNNWTFDNGDDPRWQLDSHYGQYAHSGTHSLYAADFPGRVTDAKAQLSSMDIPSDAYLYFAHAYDFETNGTSYFDGGVLEYSLDGGSTWVDAGPLMEGENDYHGKISTNYSSPLSGRSAFVGSSHGYISTRVDLTSLAGQTVTFRWRMGLDSSTDVGGWWIDDVQICSCVPVPMPAGKYDDADEAWNYTGTVTAKTGVSGPYLGTWTYLKSVGGTAEFKFEGNAFTLWYSKYTNQGKLAVYVDDNPTPVKTLNQKGSSRAWQVAWTSGNLGSGTHKIKLVHAGPSGTYVNLDAIQVSDILDEGTYEDTDPNLVLIRSFSKVSASSASGGSYLRTKRVGDTATFWFNGSQLALWYMRYKDQGKLEVYIDGALVKTLNQKSTSRVWNVSWTSGDLGAGVHKVVLKHAGPSGTYVNLDALAVGTYPYPPSSEAGTYDDLDVNWVYTGSRNALTASGAHLGGTYSELGKTGNSAEFWFTGSQLTLWYMKYKDQGKLAVYIDYATTPVATLNQNSTSRVWNVSWTSGDLGAGAHKVKLVHAGPSDKSVNLDAIRIGDVPENGMYEEDDDHLNYAGSFKVKSSSSLPGPSDGTYRQTGTVGDSVQFTFRGSQVLFWYSTYSDQGSVEVSIDGVKVATLSQKSGSRVWNVSWVSGNLGEGVHKIKLKHLGPAGKSMNIDAIQVRTYIP